MVLSRGLSHRVAKTVAFLALALAFPGAVRALETTQAEGSSGYRIGPADLLAIAVFEVPELTVDLRVSENGSIDLPLIGRVDVQGLTDNELAIKLKTLIEMKYVQRASVRVTVKEFRSRPISVVGAVKNPGPLAYTGRWTLLQALNAAGGLAERHGNTIYVLRTGANGLSDQLAIDVEDLTVQANPRVNIPVFANDMINVPAPVPVTVFCLGEVAQPGALNFQNTERVTVLTAIARAGGLTKRASSTILIKRKGTSGRESQIEVNYKRIVSQKEPDLDLEPNDVIVVKASFF